MSNENIPTVELSLSDRQPFDYVYCEGPRETRSCYHTRKSATADWTNAPASFKYTDRARSPNRGRVQSTNLYRSLSAFNLVSKGLGTNQ
jgi:hypothetical protein